MQVCSAVSRVQEDVAKVKAMTLLFDERLRAVESLVQARARLRMSLVVL